MVKFGFRNKEVVIEEEDPAMIQITTQMSSSYHREEHQVKRFIFDN